MKSLAETFAPTCMCYLFRRALFLYFCAVVEWSVSEWRLQQTRRRSPGSYNRKMTPDYHSNSLNRRSLQWWRLLDSFSKIPGLSWGTGHVCKILNLCKCSQGTRVSFYDCPASIFLFTGVISVNIAGKMTTIETRGMGAENIKITTSSVVVC